MGRAADATEVLLRLPALTWGAYELPSVGVVSRRTGTFETQFSQWTVGPIVGALAGNVLKHFRLELDYAGGAAYLEQLTEPDAHDLDLVGLTLCPAPDGAYVITAVSDQYDRLIQQAVLPGDRLLQVDGVTGSGLPLARVVEMLRGRHGELRRLVLERDGQHLTRQVPVIHVI
jgi:hypothetical protein